MVYGIDGAVVKFKFQFFIGPKNLRQINYLAPHLHSSRYLTITTEHKSKAMEIFEVPENESNIIELAG
jgi:hypothetical protein